MASRPYEFAIPYVPQVSESLCTKQDIISQIHKHSIRFIRLSWVDLANFSRCRVIPTSQFLELCDQPRPAITIAGVTFGFVGMTTTPGFSSAGEQLLTFDLQTFRICPFAPGHAIVYGFFEEKAPYLNEKDMLSTRINLCPRTILRDVEERARSAYGLQFLVGFEIEFVLLKATTPVLEPINPHGWCMSSALPAHSLETRVLEEMVIALEASGIKVLTYHSEASKGQYEIVTGPLTPLCAVDALAFTRELIYNTASKHGLKATLVPRLDKNSAGSGAHAHFSLYQSNQNLSLPPSPTPVLSSCEATFLSGILTHLPALAALSLPVRASYHRLQDGTWAGGTYVSWGTDSRETPIRLCNATTPKSRNFEFRMMDGTSNAYLVIAGLLAAGLDAIERKALLTISDCGIPATESPRRRDWRNVPKTPAELTPEERKQLGITDRLPMGWEAAKEAFSCSPFARKAFGEEFVEKYVGVNKTLDDMIRAGHDEDSALVAIF